MGCDCESQIMKPAAIVILMLLLGGCGSPLEHLSDNELRDKMRECRSVNSPAPAMIQACKNYKAECDRRREELGNYVC